MAQQIEQATALPDEKLNLRRKEDATLKKAMRGGFLLLLLGSALFIVVGGYKERVTRSLFDFKCYYFAGRCLTQGCAPYRPEELKSFYLAAGGEPSLAALVSTFVNPPTSFTIFYPFALLPWGPAHLLWMFFTGSSMVFAAFLIWEIAKNQAPLVTGALLCFLLANSVWLLMVGNAAGIAVGLCTVAVWSFVRQRFIPAGMLCFAIGLLVKPHIVGWVWLYFLLADKFSRKRALQTLLVTAVLGLPSLLWISRLDPNWMQELHSNQITTSAPGRENDPGPKSPNAYLVDAMVNLQTVTSIFWNNPSIYNGVTFLVCGPLIVFWIVTTLRAQPSPSSTWLALAAITALSMLPIYHRAHDARFLILTLPACAQLWAERGITGWLAVIINSAGFVLSGDITSVFRINISAALLSSATGQSFKVLTVALGRPIPLISLIMGIFYLWVYMRRVSQQPAIVIV